MDEESEGQREEQSEGQGWVAAWPHQEEGEETEGEGSGGWVSATPRQRYSSRGQGSFGGMHRGEDDKESDTTGSEYDTEESEGDISDSEEEIPETAPRGRRGTFGQLLDEGMVDELEEPASGDETEGTIPELDEPIDDAETKEQESEEGAF